MKKVKMIKNIFIIIGLPGSGKTHYLKNKSGFILDDKKDFFNLPEQSIPYENLYISHPMLCLKENQTRLIDNINNNYKDIKINFICFENNPEQCYKNSKKRERNILPTLKLLTKNYHFPENSRVLRVFNNKKSFKLKD